MPKGEGQAGLRSIRHGGEPNLRRRWRGGPRSCPDLRSGASGRKRGAGTIKSGGEDDYGSGVKTPTWGWKAGAFKRLGTGKDGRDVKSDGEMEGRLERPEAMGWEAGMVRKPRAGKQE